MSCGIGGGGDGGDNGGDSGGGNGNGQDTGVEGGTYAASGTYSYNPGTGILTLNTTSSDFPLTCEGPEPGTDQFTVLSITATTMEWQQQDDDGAITWTRVGAGSGILGKWQYTDNGNSYEATLNANGTFTVVGDIVQ